MNNQMPTYRETVLERARDFLEPAQSLSEAAVYTLTYAREIVRSLINELEAVDLHPIEGVLELGRPHVAGGQRYAMNGMTLEVLGIGPDDGRVAYYIAENHRDLHRVPLSDFVAMIDVGALELLEEGGHE